MGKKSSSSGDVERSKRFKKEIQVDITPEEVAEKQTQIRKNLTKIVNLEEDMRPLKDKVKTLKAENAQLRIDCEEEKENRTMYVVNEFHFANKKVLVRRDDNDEVVEERAMTAEELQEFMPVTGLERGPKGDDEEEPN